MRRMCSPDRSIHQMQTPPDETAGGCQKIAKYLANQASPISVDRLEDLATLGMLARELVEPHVGLRQLIGFVLEREM